MKKVSVWGGLVEACDWILHPFAYHKELMDYRRDYDKEILAFHKNNEKFQTKFFRAQSELDEMQKKCKKIKDDFSKSQEKNAELNDKIIELEAVIENDLETIYKVRGKIGGTTKQCNRLKKENENLMNLLAEAREKLVKTNKQLIDADEKIKLLSMKSPREKIDYTLLKKEQK